MCKLGGGTTPLGTLVPRFGRASSMDGGGAKFSDGVQRHLWMMHSRTWVRGCIGGGGAPPSLHIRIPKCLAMHFFHWRVNWPMISNVGTNDVVPQEYVELGYERRGSPNNVERRYERRGSQNVERRYEWRGSPHDKFISNVGTNDVVPRKMHYQFNYKPHSRPKELKSSLRCFDVRLSLWICEPKLVTNSLFNVIWCSISFDYEAFGEPCHTHTRVRHIFTRDTCWTWNDFREPFTPIVCY